MTMKKKRCGHTGCYIHALEQQVRELKSELATLSHESYTASQKRRQAEFVVFLLGRRGDVEGAKMNAEGWLGTYGTDFR